MGSTGIVSRQALSPVEQITESENTYFHAMGAALARWSRIEQTLFWWFWYLSALPEKKARAIFYSGQNTATRVYLVKAALQTTNRPKRFRAFILEALKVVSSYQGARNQIAHGELLFDTQEDSPTSGQWVLQQGKYLWDGRGKPENLVSLVKLKVIYDQFGHLHRALTEVYVETHPPKGERVNPGILEAHLQLVRGLPIFEGSNPIARKRPIQKKHAKSPRPKSRR